MQRMQKRESNRNVLSGHPKSASNLIAFRPIVATDVPYREPPQGMETAMQRTKDTPGKTPPEIVPRNLGQDPRHFGEAGMSLESPPVTASLGFHIGGKASGHRKKTGTPNRPILARLCCLAHTRSQHG
jgi:hypothetical protein